MLRPITKYKWTQRVHFFSTLILNIFNIWTDTSHIFSIEGDTSVVYRRTESVDHEMHAEPNWQYGEIGINEKIC